jgi:glycosyltransferase involved in cell wall biosynthesis
MDTSVIVPTRNRGGMLGTTLRTVLAQRGVEIEVIVVNDASSDDTLSTLAAFDDPRLRAVHTTTPAGPNAARNRGAAQARSPWLAFVDDDDLWAPDKLASQLRAAEEEDRAWAYAGSVNVNERLEIIHGTPPPPPEDVVARVRRLNPIPASASNVIIRRASFESEGGFHEELRSCEEWDLWIRLADSGPPAWVPEPLVAYRLHPGNAILDVEALVEGARRLEALHGTRIDWGHFHRWIAQLCLRGGQRGAALRSYARSALHGEARTAAVELSGAARHALRRRLGRPVPVAEAGGGSPWIDRARPWIEEVRRVEGLAGRGAR